MFVFAGQFIFRRVEGRKANLPMIPICYNFPNPHPLKGVLSAPCGGRQHPRGSSTSKCDSVRMWFESMAKSKTGGRRRAANNKPADRARQVSLPWMQVERGASVERWATLQGLAMLCGPITSRQVADAMCLAGNLAAMELKWAAAEGYLVRSQNPEWSEWVPPHTIEKPPARWLWHVGPVPARKEARPAGGKGKPRPNRRQKVIRRPLVGDKGLG